MAQPDAFARFLHPTGSKITEEIQQLATRWQERTVDDPSLAGAYLLIWQIARYDKRFASRKCRDQAHPNVEEARKQLSDLTGSELRAWVSGFIAEYQHNQISKAALWSLTRWLSGDEIIRLYTNIPSAREVLELQCEGLRPVSVILSGPKALNPILEKSDGLAFLIHDLEHATKFHQDFKNHQLQLGFFRMIRKSLDLGVFETPLKEPGFVRSFDYLISDMNTHPLHGLRYLYAVLVEHHLRLEKKAANQNLSQSGKARIRCLFEHLSISWNLAGKECDALIQIGHGKLTDRSAKDLEDWIWLQSSQNPTSIHPFPNQKNSKTPR